MLPVVTRSAHPARSLMSQASEALFTTQTEVQFCDYVDAPARAPPQPRQIHRRFTSAHHEGSERTGCGQAGQAGFAQGQPPLAGRRATAGILLPAPLLVQEVFGRRICVPKLSAPIMPWGAATPLQPAPASRTPCSGDGTTT